MDILPLNELVPLLAAARVQSFKCKDFQLSFHAPLAPAEPTRFVVIPPAPAAPADGSPSEPTGSADNTMSYDQELMWSASPDAAPGPTVPLTGDKPLEGEA